jgi:integrase
MAAKPKGKRRDGTPRTVTLLADGGGLYLQVLLCRDGNIRKSWVFRHQRGKRTRDMGLGSLDTFGLGEARDMARTCRQMVAKGQDPIEERKRDRASNAARSVADLTFDSAVEIYIRQHQAGWSADSVRQWRSSLAAYASPIIGRMAVAEIETPHVMKVLNPIWTEKTETASRLRGRIEQVLGWATVSGHRSGENPARWKSHLDKLLPAAGKLREVKRMPALPYADMPQFMVRLRTTRTGMSATALEFAILTAVRSHDVVHARRANIDRVARVWTIPKFSKTRRVHKVPLSDAALAVIDRVEKTIDGIGGAAAASGLLFPNDVTGATLSPNAMLEVIKKLKMKGAMTTHGARSAFRTWCLEATSFPRELAELSLGHVVGSAVEQAYLRGSALQKRAAIMTAWANFLAKPQQQLGEVIPLQGRQRARP